MAFFGSHNSNSQLSIVSDASASGGMARKLLENKHEANVLVRSMISRLTKEKPKRNYRR